MPTPLSKSHFNDLVSEISVDEDHRKELQQAALKYAATENL